MAGFLLQNSSHLTQLDWSYIRNSAKFDKIKLNLARSRPNLVRSWPDLVGFSLIRPNHNKFQRKFADSDKIFANFGEVLYFSVTILQFPTNFTIDQTDPSTTQTRNWLDQLTLVVSFGSLRPPPDADRSSPGWVQNRPSLTCEQA